MPPIKPDEEMAIRFVLARVLEALSDVERAIMALSTKVDTLITESVRHGTVEREQGEIIKRLEASLSAEAAEVARIRAQKIEGKAGLLSVFSDPKVLLLMTAIVSGVFSAIATHFGAPYVSP